MSENGQAAEQNTGTAGAIWTSLRPQQWTANLFVFVPLLLGGGLASSQERLRALGAFAVLCALSGCAHILDDMADLEYDRRHPVKRDRPIASGQLRMRWALVAFVVLLAGGLIAADNLSLRFFVAALAYVVLLVVYSFVLCRIAVLDVFAVAFVYVLRVAGGALVIDRQPHGALLVTAMLLGLLLAFGRRRIERTVARHLSAPLREPASLYDDALLRQLVGIAAGASVVFYAVYALWGEGLPAGGSLAWTVPFFAYAVLRYLYVLERGGPQKLQGLLLDDWPLVLGIALWAGAAAVLLYG